jgi:hypothetical protein
MLHPFRQLDLLGVRIGYGSITRSTLLYVIAGDDSSRAGT